MLPYSDGQPALFERPVGRGRVLMMTTPVSDEPNQDAVESAAGRRTGQGPGRS